MKELNFKDIKKGGIYEIKHDIDICRRRKDVILVDKKDSASKTVKGWSIIVEWNEWVTYPTDFMRISRCDEVEVCLNNKGVRIVRRIKLNEYNELFRDICRLTRTADNYYKSEIKRLEWAVVSYSEKLKQPKKTFLQEIFSGIFK